MPRSKSTETATTAAIANPSASTLVNALPNNHLYPTGLISVFKGTDYDSWKFRIRAMLEGRDLEDIISQPMQDTADWKKKDRIVRSLLIAHIGDEVLNHIKNATSAKSLLETLDRIYEDLPRSSQLGLQREVMAMRYKEEDNLDEYLILFENRCRCIQAAGEDLSERIMSNWFLTSLPPSYGPFLSVMDGIDARQLTWQLTKSRTRQEQAKMKLLQQNAGDVPSSVTTNGASAKTVTENNNVPTAMSAETRGRNPRRNRGNFNQRFNGSKNGNNYNRSNNSTYRPNKNYANSNRYSNSSNNNYS